VKFRATRFKAHLLLCPFYVLLGLTVSTLIPDLLEMTPAKIYVLMGRLGVIGTLIAAIIFLRRVYKKVRR